MGGTGNTGQTGEITPTAAQIANGSSATPGWVAPAATPAPVAETAAPPELRPYEQTTASTGAVAPDLGFPSAAPSAPIGTGFDHVPYPTHADPLPGERAPAPTVAATPTTPAPDPNAPSPSDWLYPGNLPMDFDPRQGEFGKPRPYAGTGAFYTPGYGAAGNFGGKTGYGPPQEGLKDKVLLPSMAAGTKLEGADIDQRNAVRREDYDRYMKLYGVGYDLPAYRNALNNLVYQQNMAGYGGTGGG